MSSRTMKKRMKEKGPIGGMEGGKEKEHKKEQLRGDFCHDVHETVSHAQSTGVVEAFCQTHYVSCPLRRSAVNVNVCVAMSGL